MKTSAKVTVQDGVFNVKFDIFEAVWGYLLYDNISLLADSKTNNLKLYSFLSGKEQTSADISKDNIEELSKSQIIEINYALGDNQTAVFKKEAIDITGKFIEAIEAQFKGKNATAIECYKAVLEANPNNYRAFGLLGRCYRTEGKMDEAYECYKKAIELAPTSPEAYCNLGVFFQKDGDEEKAQAAFCEAIDLDNFYCNALVKRAAWLLNNNPDDYELKVYNLRLSAVHQDVNSAQAHLKNYYEKMNLDRSSYADKETALFGDFADYKLQRKLKVIESCINNGAYATALNNMKEVLEFTKETSVEKKVAGWCHSRAARASKRLGDRLDFDTWKALNELVENTPSEDDLKQQAEEVARKEALEAARKIDRKAAEAASQAAIAEMENKVSEDGDYAQPIAGPIEKEVTEEEKDEALEEQTLLGGDDDIAPPPPVSEEAMLTGMDDIPAPKPVMGNRPAVPEPAPMPEPVSEPAADTDDLLMGVDDIPAPKPISEDAMLTGMDDIPAPKPVMGNKPAVPEPAPMPEPVSEPVADSDDLLMGVDDIPAPKPISEDAMLTGMDDIPAPKPVMENKPAVPKPAPMPEPVSESVADTDDLLMGVDDIPAPPPISEEAMLTGMDDIPAPKPETSKKPAPKPVIEKEVEPALKPKTTAELMAEAKPVVEDSSEPALKPMTTAELMAESKEVNMVSSEEETTLKPMSTAELMAKAKEIDVSSADSESYLKPMSTAELMAAAKDTVSPPKPVLVSEKSSAKTDSETSKENNIKLNDKYKSPVKGVNPVTVQEFFMLVLFEVMRDGDIEDSEKKFLNNLKSFLKISDSDYGKMFNHVAKQVAVNGKLDKGAEGKFNPKRVFRNLCKAALRDGVLADSEKKILIAASKIFKISEKEFKAMLLEAKK
ncbi:MAG: tetratricopeptide repeat protein [Candidatus Riflebacteria bacterium]|nr:tetratricopeptide repeat protein [Candidatus Riflebacteria bacterium]